jgi:hypothetical protein
MPLPCETDALIRTLAAAVDRAGEGKLAEGYAALRAGLARALEIQGGGARGGDELVARWCWACEWFSGRYGVLAGARHGIEREETKTRSDSRRGEDRRNRIIDGT